MAPLTVNPNTDDCCLNCRFFQVSETNESTFPYLLCLRFPPVPTTTHGSSVTTKDGIIVTGYFPTVRADWWCGEHQPK